MKHVQIWWLRFGCFITGYDYNILSKCSEIAIRKVKKYTSALLIISIIWAFVGYTFCNRYLKMDLYESLFGAIIAMLIIVQIERQILMTEKSNKSISTIRTCIAILMAVIGALVIDQIIFKDDIDKAKMESNQLKVNKLFPLRSAELNRQLKELDSVLQKKEMERQDLIKDLNANPTIKIVEVSKSQIPTTAPKDTTSGTKSKIVLTNIQTTNLKAIQNPKFNQIGPLDSQMETLRKQKEKKEASLMELQNVLEKEVGEKVGFLDELDMMIKVLSNFPLGIVVYLIWFFFLLFLELLILISKRNEIESDYEMTIQHQMLLHNKKIQLLMTSQKN